LIVADVQTFPLGAWPLHDPPGGVCGAARHLLARVIASVGPPPPVRAVRSEERALLSRTLALVDSSRCTSFAVTRRCGEANVAELYGCDADPPRRVFSRDWRSLSRKTDRPLTLPVVHQAPPHRLHAPIGGCCDLRSLARCPSGSPSRGAARHRVDLTNQDVSSPARLGACASTSGAPAVVSCHQHFRAGWMLVADSTPQASIAHPFASRFPGGRVNGAIGFLRG